jgi:RNA polymerase sigma-70 factor (sigma-E family)
MSDSEEFRAFVFARSRELLRAAWMLTGDWAGAEDLLQSALIVTWRRWSSVTRRDAPEAYVRRVMFHNFLRSRRRSWTRETATGRLPEHATTTDEYERADSRQTLITALAQLPPRQRAAVTLRYYLDLSEAQTAEVLGCSTGAVKSHTAKARARLRATPGLAELLIRGVQS